MGLLIMFARPFQTLTYRIIYKKTQSGVVIMLRKIRKQPGRCTFPGYRWCGPNCSGPGAPVNASDACCRNHDICLESGQSPCKCDQQFLRCLEPQINPYTLEGRQARIMYRAIRIRSRFTCRNHRKI